MCCLYETIWRDLCARMLVIEGWRYKLWRSGKGDGSVGVEVMVMEE